MEDGANLEFCAVASKADGERLVYQDFQARTAITMLQRGIPLLETAAMPGRSAVAPAAAALTDVKTVDAFAVLLYALFIFYFHLIVSSRTFVI